MSPQQLVFFLMILLSTLFVSLFFVLLFGVKNGMGYVVVANMVYFVLYFIGLLRMQNKEY